MSIILRVDAQLGSVRSAVKNARGTSRDCFRNCARAGTDEEIIGNPVGCDV